MLTLAVDDLVRRIHQRVPAALADEPDAVHQLRISVRRLRNVLAALRRYLDEEATGELRSQLKEWGDVLGRARDLEVHAHQAATAADATGLDEKTRSALLEPLVAAREQARADVVRWTRSEQGRDLGRLLDDWAVAPRLGDRASRPAKKAAHRIQSLLGDHRDALLLAEHVRERSNGSPAYDAVVGLCQERALAALADLPAALGELEARALRRRRAASKEG